MDLQKKLYGFIYDYWQLIRQYTPHPNNDDIEAWDKLVEEAGAMLNKHNDGSKEYSFFKDLLFAWFDYVGKA